MDQDAETEDTYLTSVRVNYVIYIMSIIFGKSGQN